MRKHIIFTGVMAAILLSAGAADAITTVQLSSDLAVASTGYVDGKVTAINTAAEELSGKVSTLESTVTTNKETYDAYVTSNDAAVAANKAAIEAEAKTRGDADAALDTRIKAFEEGDNSVATVKSELEGKITEEATTRADADTAINNTIAAMDLAEVKSEGMAIVSISEADGKVSAATGQVGTAGIANASVTEEKLSFDVATQEELNTHVSLYETLAQTVTGNETDIEGKVSALTTTVDENKTAAETALSTAKSELEGKITAETNARTTADSALDTRVTANEGAITTLNADAQTEGSVDYKINQAQTTLNGDIEALEGRMDTAEGSINTLNGDETVAGSVKAQVKTVNDKFSGTYGFDSFEACIETAPLCVWGRDKTANDFAWIAVTPDSGVAGN